MKKIGILIFILLLAVMVSPSFAAYSDCAFGDCGPIGSNEVAHEVAQGEDSSVIFNVKTEYGAKGDGVYLTDGNITSGLTVFTSATAVFTSADVGKVITILGAGGANIDLTSTITSFTNANTVTINDAASATVSNVQATYGTDDTSAIQSAIDAVATAGAGTIFFPEGVYIVNGAFTGARNAQLNLPTVALSSPMVTIKFQGAVPTNRNGRYNGGSNIYGTRNGVNGGYSILSGSKTGESGNLTNVQVIFDDMRFTTVQNPKHSGINLLDVDIASGYNLIIDTASTYSTPIPATYNDSYGIKMPGNLNGNISGGFYNLKVKTYYNGISFGEHSYGDGIQVIQATNALVFTDCSYVVNLGQVSVEISINTMLFLGTKSYVNISSLSVERWATGNFVFVTDVIDASNLAVGTINVTTSQVGGATLVFLISSGGRNLSVTTMETTSGIRTRTRGNVADLLYIQNSGTSSTTSGGGIVLQQDGGAAVGSGHRLGVVSFNGAYDTAGTTSGHANTGASIRGYAAEAFSSSSTGGTDIAFWNAPIGSSTQAESMRITNAGKVGIGNTDPSGYLVVNYPAAQTIAAGNTIAGDACGSLKLITSAGAVTTDTTNTFTAPAAGNKGCIMHVCNTGANNITLDNNANFKSAGGADVVMTADDCVTVGSTGASGVWYQLTALEAN